MPLRRIGAGAVAMALICATADVAATRSPQLDPPARGDHRRPDESFVIRLDEPFDPGDGRLALELDNVDVTSRVRPADDSYTVFRFKPYRPLARGRHVLRMVEYKEDGRIVEHARWTVRVRKVETAVQSQLSYGISNRFEEKPESGDPSRVQGQGSDRLEMYTDNGSRRYGATADFLLDSNTATGASDERRTVEVGDFLLKRASEHTDLSAGHHYPGAIQGVEQGNLIFDGYQRRGVSATAMHGPLGSALTGFALRTESIRGFEEGLGVGDGDNRISGGMFRMQPTDSVAVGLGYVSGAGRDAGFGTGASDATLDGDAANAVVDTTWLDRRLSVRAEAAYSTLDLGSAFGEVSDHAYAARLAFRPDRGLRLGERYLRWRFNLSYVDLGSTFRSIGNLGQAANLEEYRAGFDAYLGGFTFNLTGSRVEDNVDSALYPSTRTENLSTTLGWTPPVGPDFGGWLFKQPSFTLNLFGDWRETVRMPGTSTAFPTDMRTRGYVLEAAFGHPFGRWGVSGGTTRSEDATNTIATVPDMRYDSAGVHTSFRAGSRYSISPSLSYDVARDRRSDVSTRTTSLSVTQYWTILPDRLDGQLSVNLNRTATSDDTQDVDQVSADMRLSWHEGPVTLWLAGNYFEVDSRLVDFFGGTAFVFDQYRETYQFTVGISLSLDGGTRL